MLMPQSMKLHPEFDLEQAKHAYSVSGFDTNLEGELVTSPHDLFSVEVLRDRHALRRGTASPTDVFVFGKGEATRRDGTKVGGLPYWPADRRWPKDEAGTPYRFLAQFNFADSRDLLAELPGEVLLLLVQEGDDWLYEPDRIHFEWLPVGLTPIASFPPSWTVNVAHSSEPSIARPTTRMRPKLRRSPEYGATRTFRSSMERRSGACHT